MAVDDQRWERHPRAALLARSIVLIAPLAAAIGAAMAFGHFAPPPTGLLRGTAWWSVVFIVSALVLVVVDADQVVTELQDAGVPKLPNGAKFMALFVTNLRSVGKEYAAAKVDAANIATGDFAGFQKTAVEVFKRFKDSDVALAKTVAILRKVDRRDRLVAALRRVESCGMLTDR